MEEGKLNCPKRKSKGQSGKAAVGRKGPEDRTAEEMGSYVVHKIQQM